jgi:hypothetical protein
MFSISKLADLQQSLMTIQPETVSNYHTAILSSIWVTSPFMVSQLAESLILTATCRFSLSLPITQLLSSLSSSSSSSNSLRHLKSNVIDFLFRSIRYSLPFPTVTSWFSILFHFHHSGFLPISDLLNPIHSLTKNPNFKRSCCWILCYFAPEIESTDRRLFNTL